MRLAKHRDSLPHRGPCRSFEELQANFTEFNRCQDFARGVENLEGMVGVHRARADPRAVREQCVVGVPIVEGRQPVFACSFDIEATVGDGAHAIFEGLGEAK